MAAETELKISLTPVFEDTTDMIGQLRRTGESLLAAADALQRLSDGGPDSARTTPDIEEQTYSVMGDLPVKCPAALLGTPHDGHRFEMIASPPDHPDWDVIHSIWNCPGHPVRPWHPEHIRTS